MEETQTLRLQVDDQLWSVVAEARPPHLHEAWSWEGDTSVLPHKVAEILNSIAIYDASDPKFASDDPFDFERPYKSEQIA